MYIVACGLPRDRPKPFQSFPDKTGVGIGEEVVKSIFIWSFDVNSNWAPIQHQFH